MGIDQDRIKLFSSPLVGFAGEQVQPIGLISLIVTTRTSLKQSTIMVDFLVVDRPSAYNVIISRLALNKWKAITSTYHLMLKFPIKEEVREVKGDQVAAMRYYNTSMKKVSDSTTLTVGTVGEAKGKPTKPLEDMVVGEGKTLKIGTTKVRDGLVTFLWQNMEVFAWMYEDMPVTNPEHILHHLNVDLTMKPIK